MSVLSTLTLHASHNTNLKKTGAYTLTAVLAFATPYLLFCNNQTQVQSTTNSSCIYCAHIACACCALYWGGKANDHYQAQIANQSKFESAAANMKRD